MNVYNLLRSCPNNVQGQLLRRGYAFKSDLKIKWVRPEKVSSIKPEKSGDLSKLPAVNPNELLHEFRDSKELESAEPAVKSLFQLGNNRQFYTAQYQREQLVKDVQRHPLDYGSMEAKLAKMTANIRRFQEHMDKFPRDRKIKVMLKEMIEKRKKFLKYLRRWDYKRFEWVLEKLDLVYKPPPPEYHWITRKESLQKLTDLYCEQIKEERLQEYRDKLEAQQIPFLEDAIQKMQFVRKEQIEADVPVTVTEEMVNEMQQQLADLKVKQSQKLQLQQKTEEEKF